MPLTHCPRCKAPVIEQDRVCPGCGFDLDGVRAEVADLMKPLEQRYAEQPTKSIALRRALNEERAAAAAVEKATARRRFFRS